MTILQMNNDFDHSLYWWVSDYDWAMMCFGLQTRNGSTTEGYEVYKQIFID